MYCDNCGCELGENVRKCPVCGKEFPLIEPEVDDSTTVLTSEPDGKLYFAAMREDET